MNGVPPSWIHLAEDAVYGGHVGDGGLPDDSFFRIDRLTADSAVLVVPSDPASSSITWPSDWDIVRDPESREELAGIVTVGPGAAGNPVTSWIGPTGVDLDRLRTAFATRR